MTPSGMRGVLNDAVSIYIADAAARLCVSRAIGGTGPV